MEIRTFRADEWRSYREIRLASLEDAPDAFGGTYGESVHRPDAAWQARLAEVSEETGFPVAAFENDVPVALAWGRIDPRDGSVAILNQMWTSPEYRGRGLARQLVQAVIRWAAGTSATELQLSVTVGNEPASRLYTSLGFVRTGDTEPLREGSERVAELMKKSLA